MDMKYMVQWIYLKKILKKFKESVMTIFYI